MASFCGNFCWYVMVPFALIELTENSLCMGMNGMHAFMQSGVRKCKDCSRGIDRGEQHNRLEAAPIRMVHGFCKGFKSHSDLLLQISLAACVCSALPKCRFGTQFSLSDSFKASRFLALCTAQVQQPFRPARCCASACRDLENDCLKCIEAVGAVAKPACQYQPACQHVRYSFWQHFSVKLRSYQLGMPR